METKTDCDMSHLKLPARKSAEDWLLAEVKEARRLIEYYTDAHAKEVERARSRNQWVAALRDAITKTKEAVKS